MLKVGFEKTYVGLISEHHSWRLLQFYRINFHPKRWKGFVRKPVSEVLMSPLGSKRWSASLGSFGTNPKTLLLPQGGKIHWVHLRPILKLLPGTKSWPDGSLGNGGPKAAWLNWILAGTQHWRWFCLCWWWETVAIIFLMVGTVAILFHKIYIYTIYYIG